MIQDGLKDVGITQLISEQLRARSALNYFKQGLIGLLFGSKIKFGLQPPNTVESQHYDHPGPKPF